MLITNLPDTRDVAGRNIDDQIGALSGEGSLQQVESVAQVPVLQDAKTIPADAVRGADGLSYYGQPILKEPVWRWYIPAYFYVGGVAGAAAALGAAAQLAVGGGNGALARRKANRGEHRLVRRCRMIARGGAVASGVLLIADLGRPA